MTDWLPCWLRMQVVLSEWGEMRWAEVRWEERSRYLRMGVGRLGGLDRVKHWVEGEWDWGWEVRRNEMECNGMDWMILWTEHNTTQWKSWLTPTALLPCICVFGSLCLSAFVEVMSICDCFSWLCKLVFVAFLMESSRKESSHKELSSWVRESLDVWEGVEEGRV